MAREVVSARAALVSVAVLEGIHFYSFSSIKFAHDQGQLMFWALTVWLLYRGLTRERPLDWALAGAALALAFWSKYAAAMLAATLFLFLVIDPQARRCWRGVGPWIALASFALVLAPHAIWLVDHDFLPFSYVDHRSAHAARAIDYLVYPALFAGSQLMYLLPAIAMIALLVGRPGGGAAAPPMPPVDGFARRYLTVATFGPFLLTVGAATLTGRSLVAMWGYPFWLFFGLTAIAWLRPALDLAGLRRFAAGLAVAFVATTTIYAGSELFEALWNHRMKATNFPGRPLAAEVTRQWRGVSDRPLAFVVGEMFVASNVSVYASDHPRVFLDADRRKSPWIDPDTLRRDGAVIVWSATIEGEAMPAALRQAFPQAEQRPAIELPWQTLARVPPIRIGFAIVRPQP
jgi:4-amino-4-deoxy-L-arabinose transferase-like glycosyltransferase